MIKLFDSTATEFDTLGLGNLTDVTACIVTEERNGTFELEMEYPINGIHYSDIKLRNIIVCKSNPFSSYQAFRIYYISKPIDGIITVDAEHISYDMSGIIVSSCQANNAAAAFTAMKNNALPTCNFTFTTDKEVQATFKVTEPTSMRSLLGGIEGSILDIYGTGEYEFDNYNVSFKTHRGKDRGVTIRYGKNLTDLTQEENCTKLYTAVYPFWHGTYYENDTEQDVLVTLPEKTVNVEGTFNYTKILSLNMGEYFDEMPTEDQLRTSTEYYINNNDLGKPKVSLDVSFLQLEQSEEYEQLKLLESVYLCDTVTVIFPELGVESTAKCIETEYNAITNRYKKIKLGDSRTDLASTIVSQSEEIANIPTASFMEQEIEKATKTITGGLGGYVMLHSSSGQKKPDELLILDEQSGGDYTKANNIWRFNKEGFGFSDKGYNGPYSLFAVTSDGSLTASKVTAEGILAGTITAALNIISPYIGDDADMEKASFYLDSSSKKIYGANIEGSTFSQDGTKGKMDIKNGWIYGTSTKDAGSAVVLDGPGCQTLYGSRYMHSEMNGEFIKTETLNVVRAGEEHKSDKRLKDNLKLLNYEESKSIIDHTNAYSFEYKKNKGKTHFGVIAQELLEAIKNEGYTEGEIDTVYKIDDMYGVAYVELIPHLMNYVKYLQNEINELRKEIK